MDTKSIRKEKKLLPLTDEIQQHHTFVLNNHFDDNDLKTDDELSLKTAFPTPNELYKQKLQSTIKHKKTES